MGTFAKPPFWTSCLPYMALVFGKGFMHVNAIYEFAWNQCGLL